MARRKEDLEKITIRIKNGDKDELDEFYPNLGYTRVIRSLVSQHIKMLRARAQAKVESSEDDLKLNISVTKVLKDEQ